MDIPEMLTLDIYSEVPTELDEELLIEAGDLRCQKTGRTFEGVFVLKEIKEVILNDDSPKFK